MVTSSYEILAARFRRASVIGDAQSILHWDWSTMMPPGGAGDRAEQLAVLATLRQEILVHPEVEGLLDRAEDEELDDWQRADLREMRWSWTHSVAVPSDLLDAVSRAGSACETAWRDARKTADFAKVLPVFETLLERVREVAAVKAERLGLSPYDALLDAYEPGCRAEHIAPLFNELTDFLPDFCDRVIARQAGAPEPIRPEGPFDRAKQEALAKRLMGALGFDFDHGRLDVSAHPFCGGTAGDIRMTTRYDETDVTSALMGVLHETGHALYEMGLPEAWRGHPVGGSRSMSIHESQSLLIEMQVCRSRPFFDFAAPLMAAELGVSGPAWAPENLAALHRRVRKGFIRVDADEVTYPLHVILRYRLETALIAGELAAKDLPEAWNAAFESMFGMRPPDDGQGCLQDIHWYDGAFGYFPTYTLGALSAAQLFAAAKAALPELMEQIALGAFAPLLAWLRSAVHGRASRHSTSELMVRATGAPLSSAAFKAHLKQRYLP